jgi:hypothetical protein
MNTRLLIQPWRVIACATTLLAAAALPIFAQEPETSPSAGSSPSAASVATSPMAAPAGQPNEAEMMQKMMELSKLNENHKTLAQLAGTWAYSVTMWMSPDAPPMKSSGTSITKPIMNGRYFSTDITGMMKMPGADGKLKDVTFKGMSVDGYDNAKQKFVSSWVDNMGTGILLSEGTYDPGTKSFTYTSEEEMIPGTKTRVREVLKLTDSDHHTLEWYEDRGGQEVKTMEIAYTRKK